MTETGYYNNNDFQGLMELMRQWDGNYVFTEEIMMRSIQDIAARPDNRLVVARVNGRVAGYAQIIECFYLGLDPFIDIVQLLVSENHRSTGIGKNIMTFIENDALKHNFHIIKLSSQVHRSGAHIFYERLGYENFKISRFYKKKINTV